MEQIWLTMYERAKMALKPRDSSTTIQVGSVAAAVESISGQIYTGICVDSACTLGICAERNALFAMITEGENAFKRVIAIDLNGKALPPCGACREFMAQCMQTNYHNVEIMLDFEKNEIITLGELMPKWWL